jgi:hypothetical protein
MRRTLTQTAKRTITELMILFSLPLGSAIRLPAQSLSADRFLEAVSAHPAGDQAERDQSMKTADALNSASAAEAERMLPSIMTHVRVGTEEHARAYAAGFLLIIAIRPDGAALLSTRSKEIASLLVDADPGMQHVALAVTDYVIAKGETNKQPYLSALQTAMQKTQTPQDVGVGIISPLLKFSHNDPAALKSVLAFLQRDDLTPSTRRELVHSLGTDFGLPEEVDQYLARELDDPDPTVRAAALVAYADSTMAAQVVPFADSKTSFHALARERVERIANDPKENPQVRELAKQAIAGKTGLNPNIDMAPDKPNHP